MSHGHDWCSECGEAHGYIGGVWQCPREIGRAAEREKLRARVAELEGEVNAGRAERAEYARVIRERDDSRRQAASDREALQAHFDELERERDNANAALKLATDLCDELESRALAAEERSGRLEDAAIDHAIWDGEHSRERLIDAIGREKVEAALAALAAGEAPAREGGR